MKSIKWQYLGVVLFTSIGILPTFVKSQTQIGGSISTNTTLGPTGSPAGVVYEVTSSLTVQPGVTLTIQPGTILKFRSGTSLTISQSGVLDAQGTPGNEIVFTSLADDSFGGDTNGDGSATSPSPGDWGDPLPPGSVFGGGGIRVFHTRPNPPTTVTFNHCIVRYATVGIRAATTPTAGSAAEISLTNTEVSNSSSYPVITTADGIVSALNPSNTYLNNGRQAIGTTFSFLSANATWTDQLPIAILSRANPALIIDSGVTLSLQPGTVVKFESNASLMLNGNASIGAVGVCSPTEQVVFTSLKDDSFGGDTNGDGNATTPASGDWDRISLRDNSSIFFDTGTIRFANIGIAANTTAPVTIINSNLTDNTEAIRNFRSSPVVNATGNWWGDPTGPFNASSNPGGLGNPVSDFVDFSSFAIEPLCAVENNPPVVEPITAPVDPVQVNTEVNASADFTDPDIGDTHTALWDWGDNSTSVGTVNQANDSVTGTHTYTAAGVYTVTLTVTDEAGESDQSVFQFVVIFDPSAGFVTGGGWIDSPPEACPDFCGGASGKANFGFVSEYKKGASVPTGQTQFQFKAGDLNFHSSSYDWLVIAGAKAMYKGTGTINGTGSYSFQINAIDGQLNGGGGVDKFRIKTKEAGSGVIYDNQPGSGENDDPTTELGGGSIKIHNGGNGNQAPSMAAAEDELSLPQSYFLSQNHPNPFNPSTTISFQIPEKDDGLQAIPTSLKIYDVRGRLVRTLMDESLLPGSYSVHWDGSDGNGEQVSSGIYFYTITAGSEFTEMKKMLVLK